jgi:flagellar biosynthesis protein FliR
MSALIELSRQQLLVFLFVLLRVAGLTLVAPGLDARFAPHSLRLLLAIAVALLVAPLYWSSSTMPPGDWPQLVVPLCREAVLGLVLGLTLLILVSAMRAAGQAIGQFSGLSLAEVAHSDTGGSSPLGELLALLATAVFFLTGGHRQVLTGLLDTFAWMPPGQVGFSAGLVGTLSEVIGHSLLLAVRVTAPVLVALVLTSLILGLVARLAPQFNVLASCLGVNSLIAWTVLALCLSSAVWIFQDQTQVSLEMLGNAIARLGHGTSSGP